MPLVCLFALLPLLGLPNALGSLTVADRTTAYLRPHTSNRGVALDLETLPSAEAALAWRNERLALSYSPRLTLADVDRPNERALLVVHSAALSFSHQEPRFQLALTQTLSIGRQLVANLNQASVADPTAPASPSLPRVGLLPNTQSLLVANEQTSAFVAYLWSARLRHAKGTER